MLPHIIPKARLGACVPFSRFFRERKEYGLGAGEVWTLRRTLPLRSRAPSPQNLLQSLDQQRSFFLVQEIQRKATAGGYQSSRSWGTVVLHPLATWGPSSVRSSGLSRDPGKLREERAENEETGERGDCTPLLKSDHGKPCAFYGKWDMWK